MCYSILSLEKATKAAILGLDSFTIVRENKMEPKCSENYDNPESSRLSNTCYSRSDARKSFKQIRTMQTLAE